MIKEHMIDKLKRSRGNKIRKIADSIKRNVNNRSKIWEVKRRVTRRMLWKDKLKAQKERYCRGEIIKGYEEYYKQLLTTRKPDNIADTIAEERVKKEFENIMKQKNDIRREKKKFAMVKKVISTMKKGKAGDKLG